MRKNKKLILDVLEKEQKVLNKNTVVDKQINELFKINNWVLSSFYTADSIAEAIKELFGYDVFGLYSNNTINFRNISGNKINTIESNYLLIKNSINDLYLSMVKSTINILENVQFEDLNNRNESNESIDIKNHKNKIKEYKLIKKELFPQDYGIDFEFDYIFNKDILMTIKPLDKDLYEDVKFIFDNSNKLINDDNRILPITNDDELIEEPYDKLYKKINNKISSLENNVNNFKELDSKTKNNILSKNNLNIIQSAITYYYKSIEEVETRLKDNLLPIFINKYSDYYYKIQDDEIIFLLPKNSNEDLNIIEENYKKLDENIHKIFSLHPIFDGDVVMDDNITKFHEYINILNRNLKDNEDLYKSVNLIINNKLKNKSDINVFKNDYSSNIEHGFKLMGQIDVDNINDITIKYKSFIDNDIHEYDYNSINFIDDSENNNDDNNDYNNVIKSIKFNINNRNIILNEDTSDSIVALWNRKIQNYTNEGIIFLKGNYDFNSDVEIIIDENRFNPLIFETKGKHFLDLNLFYDELIYGINVISKRNNVDIFDSTNEILDEIKNLESYLVNSVNNYIKMIIDYIYINYFNARAHMLKNKVDISYSITNIISEKNKVKHTFNEIDKLNEDIKEINEDRTLSFGDIFDLNEDSSSNQSFSSIITFFEKISQILLIAPTINKDFNLENVEFTENVIGRYTDIVDYILKFIDDLNINSTIELNEILDNDDIGIDFKRKLLIQTYSLVPDIIFNNNENLLSIKEIKNSSEEEIDQNVEILKDIINESIDKTNETIENVNSSIKSVIRFVKKIAFLIEKLMTFIYYYKNINHLLDDVILYLWEVLIRNIFENVVYQPIAQHYTKWKIFKSELGDNYRSNVKSIYFTNLQLSEEDFSNRINDDLNNLIYETDSIFNELGFYPDNMTLNQAEKLVKNKNEEYDNYIENVISNRGDYTSTFDEDLYDLNLKRFDKKKSIFYHQYRTPLTDDFEVKIKDIISKILLLEVQSAENINNMIYNEEYSFKYKNLERYIFVINNMISQLNNGVIKDYFSEYMNQYKETKGYLEKNSIKLQGDNLYFIIEIDDDDFINNKYDNILQYQNDIKFAKGKNFKYNYNIEYKIYKDKQSDIIDLYKESILNEINYESILNIFKSSIMNLITNPSFNKIIFKYFYSYNNGDNNNIISLLNYYLIKRNENIDILKNDNYNNLIDENLSDKKGFKITSSYSGNVISSLNGLNIVYFDEKRETLNKKEIDDCNENFIKNDINLSLDIDINSNKSISFITFDLNDLPSFTYLTGSIENINDSLNKIMKNINNILNLPKESALNNLDFWDLYDRYRLNSNNLLNKCIDEEEDENDNISSSKGTKEGINEQDNIFCKAISCFWNNEIKYNYIKHYREDYLNKDETTKLKEIKNDYKFNNLNNSSNLISNSNILNNSKNNNISYCESAIELLEEKLKNVRGKNINDEKSKSHKLKKGEITKFINISEHVINKMKNLPRNNEYKNNNMIFIISLIYKRLPNQHEFKLLNEAYNNNFNTSYSEIIFETEYVNDVYNSEYNFDDLENDSFLNYLESYIEDVVLIRIYGIKEDNSKELLTGQSVLSSLDYLFNEYNSNKINNFKKSINNIKDNINDIDINRDNINDYLSELLSFENNCLRINNLYETLHDEKFYNVFLSSDKYSFPIRFRPDENSINTAISSLILTRHEWDELEGKDGLNLGGLQYTFSYHEKRIHKNEKQYLLDGLYYNKVLDKNDKQLINSKMFIRSEHENNNIQQNIYDMDEEKNFCGKEAPNLLLGLIQSLKGQKNKKNNFSNLNSSGGSESFELIKNLLDNSNKDLSDKLNKFIDEFNNQSIEQKFYDMLLECDISDEFIGKDKFGIPNIKQKIIDKANQYDMIDLISTEDLDEDVDDSYCI